jgi:methionine aminopeptidase
LKDKDNNLDTNSMNKSARKLRSYMNIVAMSRVDTVAYSHLLVVTKDLVLLSTSFR